MRNKALFNKALLRDQLWLITPYSGLICHGGTLHGGRLTGHDKWQGAKELHFGWSSLGRLRFVKPSSFLKFNFVS